VNYAVFRKSTGELICIGETPTEEAALMQADGDDQDVLLNVDADFNQYVENGILAHRPSMPVSQIGTRLSVPPGTAFLVTGPATASGVTSDGVIEFEFSEPGTYTVVLKKWPYRDAEVTLEG